MRRPSVFLACAVALAVGVVVQHALWFAADDFDAIAFIGAACIALGLGWAAQGATVWNAAGRAALAVCCILVGWMVALAFLLLVPAPVDLAFSDIWGSHDGQEHSTARWLLTQFLPSAVLVAAASAPFGAVAWSYGALSRQRLLRLVPAAVVLAPVTLWLFIAWDEGALSFVATLLPCAWLIWALRRSRAPRAEGRAVAGR